MKTLKTLGFLLAACMLAGCSNAGFRSDATPEIITPGVHARTTVRTWDDQGKPTEYKVKKDPAYLYDQEIEQK